MSRLGINTGSNPNDGQGDPLRIAMGKINSNFTEIYSTFGDGSNLDSIPNVAENLTGNPIINVSGILNTGITTTEHLEVRNITSTGIVTAVQFVGDGSQLSNVTALVGGLEVLDNDVRRGIARELNFGDNITSTGPDGVGRVTISVGSGLTVAYSPTSGVANYALLSGVSTTAGYATTSGYSVLSGVSGYATTSGISTVARGLTGTPNLNVGVVTAVSFIGDGSGLLNVPVTGIITYAQQSALSYGLIGTPSISVYSVGISSNVAISGITSFYNSVHFEDIVTLNIGDNDELQLFHNGSDSYIDNSSSGNLIIRDGGTGIQLRRSGGGPNAGLMASFNNNAGVELYYDSVLKLQTFSGGVAINDSVGIGSTAGNPPYRLTVSGVGATITSGLVNAIADLTSSVNGYGQVNIRNSFAGSNSSGDLVITADTGTDTTNYLDLGINNSSFSSGSWTVNGASDGYLYTSDSNLSIGVVSSTKYLSLFAGGTLVTNEQIRVTTTGVGIGSTNPTSKLTVSGDVKISGIITATTFSGNATTAGYATTAGISTTSQGLTGTPNISVGVITATDYRIQSVGEKTTVVNGNTISLVYNTGGGNIAICTNPSGDITLNVTGIPTDTTFNNYSLTFSVIVSNTGTARSCTTVNLNGVSRTIKWFGGSLSAAISGVTTTTGYDIYNFTGINTVGSASTATNYIVFGSVNGGYR
jgi:hypothetical protein